MKTLLVASSLLLVLGGARAPREVFAPAQQEHAGQSKGEHTPLEERMHAMEDQLKALRRSLRDPSRVVDSLASLAKFQEAALVAKSETPRMSAKVPEGERAKFVSDYRREMLHALELSLAVERALLDGKHEEALARFEELRNLEDPAHSKFTEEEK